MKIESTGFTRVELEQFLDEMLDHDRQLLADRLERASARLAELGPRVEAGGGDAEWSQHELLAHIAVLTKFYGVLEHKISTAQMSRLDLLQNVNLRDVLGEKLAQIEPPELLRMALADQERTLKLLRAADASSMRRTATQENGQPISAEEVARLPLVNHLEMHLDQLERALRA